MKKIAVSFFFIILQNEISNKTVVSHATTIWNVWNYQSSYNYNYLYISATDPYRVIRFVYVKMLHKIKIRLCKYLYWTASLNFLNGWTKAIYSAYTNAKNIYINMSIKSFFPLFRRNTKMVWLEKPKETEFIFTFSSSEEKVTLKRDIFVIVEITLCSFKNWVFFLLLCICFEIG